MAVAVVGQTGQHRPIVSGILGGLLGGALMTLPAILWGLTHGTVWYPLNLLAALVLGADRDLTQFHADWFIVAFILHGILSTGFGVAYALLARKLRRSSAPFAWGGWLR